MIDSNTVESAELHMNVLCAHAADLGLFSGPEPVLGHKCQCGSKKLQISIKIKTNNLYMYREPAVNYTDKTFKPLQGKC